MTLEWKTPKDFKNATLGKRIDMDGWYGSQCPVAGTMVTMGDGRYKAVELIDPGENVKGGNIVCENSHKLSKIVKVKTTSGEFRVSPEHKLELVDGDIVEAKELAKGDKLRMDYDLPKKAMFNLSDDELRFFGFWLGDGTKAYRWANSTKPEIFVTVSVDRKNKYIEKMNLAINKRPHSNGKASVYRLRNSDHPTLVKLIHSLHGKELPQWFTASQYKLIVEGYLEADGSKHRKGIIATSVNKELLVGVQFACAVNDIYARLSGPIKRKNTNLCDRPKDLYVLSVYPERGFTSIVMSVDEDKDDYVYVINLDGDHLYWADNYHFHNCWDLADYFWVNQLGRAIRSGTAVATAWTNPIYRKLNQGRDFELITDKKKLEPGDWVIYKKTATAPYGHVNMVTSVITKGKIIYGLGQNQHAPYDGSGCTTKDKWSLDSFAGAFRLKAWHEDNVQILHVADRVELLERGNTKYNGMGKPYGKIGSKQYVLGKVVGAKYPYKIGSKDGKKVTGYFKKSQLKKV